MTQVQGMRNQRTRNAGETRLGRHMSRSELGLQPDLCTRETLLTPPRGSVSKTSAPHSPSGPGRTDGSPEDYFRNRSSGKPSGKGADLYVKPVPYRSIRQGSWCA